jgi:hypothetical protein
VGAKQQPIRCRLRFGRHTLLVDADETTAFHHYSAVDNSRIDSLARAGQQWHCRVIMKRASEGELARIDQKHVGRLAHFQ